MRCVLMAMFARNKGLLINTRAQTFHRLGYGQDRHGRGARDGTLHRRWANCAWVSILLD